MNFRCGARHGAANSRLARRSAAQQINFMKDKLSLVKLGRIVEDFDIYPRVSVDPGHTNQIYDAIKSGASLPHILLDPKYRLVDGFHRYRAYRKLHGKKWKDTEIKAVVRTYPDEQTLFEDAMKLNASHGRALTRYDRDHAALLAMNLGMELTRIAAALNSTTIAITKTNTRCAVNSKTKSPVPLKQPIRHMAARPITQEQIGVIPKIGGNNQAFYANQLILLIDSELLDMENEELLKRLAILRDKLNALKL